MQTKKRLALAGLALTVAGGAALADYDGRVVGDWVTRAKEDRFGDGGTFVAFTVDGDIGLGVRCIQRELSVAIIDPDAKFSKGDTIEFAFRIDRGEIIKTTGVALNSRLVQLITDSALVKRIKRGREAAVRVDKAGVVSTRIFKTGGAARAFADLEKECPLDGRARSEK